MSKADKRKVCKDCGVEKGFRQFNIKRDNVDGRKNVCRLCQRKANAQYRNTPEGRLRRAFHQAKATAKRYAVRDTLTFEELKATFEVCLDHGCVYCGEPLGDDWSVEHIIPFSKGGTNEIHNVVIVHTGENYAKGNKPAADHFKAEDAMEELLKYIYVMSGGAFDMKQIDGMLRKGTVIDE